MKAAKDVIKAGTKAADGSVFAGLTPDGKQHIYVMPKDLGVTLRFNEAAERVAQLNTAKALGHNDWQIPSLEILRILQKNQNEGSLKGAFNTTGDKSDASGGFPGWYWSSTPANYDYPTVMPEVAHFRFSDGINGWSCKDSLYLGCCPVRLVPLKRL